MNELAAYLVQAILWSGDQGRSGGLRWGMMGLLFESGLFGIRHIEDGDFLGIFGRMVTGQGGLLFDDELPSDTFLNRETLGIMARRAKALQKIEKKEQARFGKDVHVEFLVIHSGQDDPEGVYVEYRIQFAQGPVTYRRRFEVGFGGRIKIGKPTIVPHGESVFHEVIEEGIEKLAKPTWVEETEVERVQYLDFLKKLQGIIGDAPDQRPLRELLNRLQEKRNGQTEVVPGPEGVGTSAGLEEWGQQLMRALQEAQDRVAPYAVGGDKPLEVKKKVEPRLAEIADFIASQNPRKITFLKSGGESVVLDLGNDSVLTLRPVTHWEHLKDYLELLRAQRGEAPKYPFMNRVLEMKLFDDLLLLVTPRLNTQNVDVEHLFTINRQLEEAGLLWDDQHPLNIGLDAQSEPRILDLSGIEKRDSAGLEEVQAVEARVRERWDGMRSAVPALGWVVVGKEVGSRYPELKDLAGLEERILVNGDPAGTVFKLIRRDVAAGVAVNFYGGLEEGEELAVVADLAGISVRIVGLESSSFNDELRQILAGLGIPDAAISAGLEELADDLTFLGQAA